MIATNKMRWADKVSWKLIFHSFFSFCLAMYSWEFSLDWFIPPPQKQNKQKPSYVHKLSRILSKRKKGWVTISKLLHFDGRAEKFVLAASPVRSWSPEHLIIPRIKFPTLFSFFFSREIPDRLPGWSCRLHLVTNSVAWSAPQNQCKYCQGLSRSKERHWCDFCWGSKH